MTPRAARSLLLFLLLFGCGGPREAERDPNRDGLLAWQGLDQGFERIGPPGEQVVAYCDPRFATWFVDFGVRGLACAATFAGSASGLERVSGLTMYRFGPHRVRADQAGVDQSRFALTDPAGFGHYNPAFVRWLADHFIVGEGNAAARAATQSIYDRRLRRLARVYWVVYSDMAADGFPDITPAGELESYEAYLDAVERGHADPEGFSVMAFMPLSEGVVQRIGFAVENPYEAIYEANTAYGFWMRRRADGTVGEFYDGLRRLLATYDVRWLSDAE